MTGWTEVTRKKKKMVQIFVKVDGGKTSAMEMEISDKVDDIVKKIPISDQDVYVASGGRILRRSDKSGKLRGSRREHSKGHEQNARRRKTQGQKG